MEKFKNSKNSIQILAKSSKDVSLSTDKINVVTGTEEARLDFMENLYNQYRNRHFDYFCYTNFTYDNKDHLLGNNSKIDDIIRNISDDVYALFRLNNALSSIRPTIFFMLHDEWGEITEKQLTKLIGLTHIAKQVKVVIVLSVEKLSLDYYEKVNRLRVYKDAQKRTVNDVSYKIMSHCMFEDIELNEREIPLSFETIIKADKVLEAIDFKDKEHSNMFTVSADDYKVEKLEDNVIYLTKDKSKPIHSFNTRDTIYIMNELLGRFDNISKREV